MEVPRSVPAAGAIKGGMRESTGNGETGDRTQHLPVVGRDIAMHSRTTAVVVVMHSAYALRRHRHLPVIAVEPSTVDHNVRKCPYPNDCEQEASRAPRTGGARGAIDDVGESSFENAEGFHTAVAVCFAVLLKVPGRADSARHRDRAISSFMISLVPP